MIRVGWVWTDGRGGSVDIPAVVAVVAANLRMALSMSIYGSMFAIVPSDTVNIKEVLTGLYVGTAGNVAMETVDGHTDIVPVPYAGVILPVQIRKVLATGTTATNLFGMR